MNKVKQLRSTGSQGTKSYLSIINSTLAWLTSTIRYQPFAGQPSIQGTLSRKAGDCNEMSQLFVALMKTFGIEAEMVFGLVHVSNQSWGYHAWARIKVDKQWIEIDPSRGKIIKELGISVSVRVA